jgi:hypothetical protein
MKLVEERSTGMRLFLLSSGCRVEQTDKTPIVDRINQLNEQQLKAVLYYCVTSPNWTCKHAVEDYSVTSKGALH